MTGQVTVVFGETVSGRPLILRCRSDGRLFINTVPVVVTVDDDVTLGELLDTVQHDKTRCWTIITSVGRYHCGFWAPCFVLTPSPVYGSYPVDARALTTAYR